MLRCKLFLCSSIGWNFLETLFIKHDKKKNNFSLGTQFHFEGTFEEKNLLLMTKIIFQSYNFLTEFKGKVIKLYNIKV